MAKEGGNSGWDEEGVDVDVAVYESFAENSYIPLPRA